MNLETTIQEGIERIIRDEFSTMYVDAVNFDKFSGLLTSNAVPSREDRARWLKYIITLLTREKASLVKGGHLMAAVQMHQLLGEKLAELRKFLDEGGVSGVVA